MAEAVWSTIVLYGLEGKVSNLSIAENSSYLLQVLAVNSDNASNNDTMMEELEKISTLNGHDFDAEEARLRCMPHTVHLAAIEVAT